MRSRQTSAVAEAGTGQVALVFFLFVSFLCSTTGRPAATAQERNPVEAAGYYQRGLAEARAGNEAAAISNFEHSLALDPNRFETYKALDAVLSKQRRWTTIVQYWTQYIELHPDDGRAYCQRGGAYSWLHNTAQAAADAEKACSLGDQVCCDVVRAHQAPSHAAAGEQPWDPEAIRVLTAVFTVVLMGCVLLIMRFIWFPKTRGSMDMPKRTRYFSMGIGDLDRPAATFYLFLLSSGLTGIALAILFYIRLIGARAMILLLSPMTLAVMGIYLFVRGLAIFREFRVILTSAESPIRGLAMGFVEVHGKATGAQTLPSPLSGSPCFFYKAVITDKSGAESEEVGGNPFYLVDATGAVRVDPTGLECDLLPNYDAGSRQYPRVEYCILPGHWYDLAGTCVENPHPRDDEDRNMIVKGSEEPTFLISWRSEKGIKTRVGRRARYCIFVGAALILLGAAIGLWFFGLL
jgi:hypothetical protein